LNKDYLFTSERLGFRNWKMDDLDILAALCADPEVMEYFPKTLSRDETEAYLLRMQRHFETHGYNYFATEAIDSGELIGFIGLAYQTYDVDFLPATDIGWRLKKSAWGKGYATEGAGRCLQFAFEELKLDRIVSTCLLANIRSENVMKKIGMKRMGEYQHPKLREHPEYAPHLWYEILSERG
jgi:RimJ/RimL family protein N-acetyltransferase